MSNVTKSIEVRQFDDPSESSESTMAIALSSAGSDSKPRRLVVTNEKGTRLMVVDAVDGALEVTAGFEVTGATDLTGNLDVTGDVAVVGNTALEGDLTLTEGDVAITGAAEVTGDVTVTGAVDVTGNTALTGNLAVTGGLTVTSTTAALILPRMTTVQRDALTPAAGMLIYNTSTGTLDLYNGVTESWETMAAG